MKNTNESDLDRVLLGQEYPPDLKMEKPEILSELNQLYLDLSNQDALSERVITSTGLHGECGLRLTVCIPWSTNSAIGGQLKDTLTQTEAQINTLASDWASNRILLIEQEISRLEAELKTML